MNAIKTFRKESSFYPVLPGLSIELGDFGHWHKNEWQRIGNIKRDFRKISFTEKDRPINQVLKIAIGATITSDVDSCLTALTAQGEVNIRFSQENSLYYEAELTNEFCFCSPKGELEPFLRTLSDWDSNYWIVTSLLKAKRYVVFMSKKAGAGISIKCDIPLDEPVESQAAVRFSCSGDTQYVQQIIPMGEEEQVVGMRFIKFDKKIYEKERKITYTGENYEVDMEQMSEERPYSM